jgi:hypothetical protein
MSPPGRRRCWLPRIMPFTERRDPVRACAVAARPEGWSRPWAGSLPQRGLLRPPDELSFRRDHVGRCREMPRPLEDYLKQLRTDRSSDEAAGQLTHEGQPMGLPNEPCGDLNADGPIRDCVRATCRRTRNHGRQ